MSIIRMIKRLKDVAKDWRYYKSVLQIVNARQAHYPPPGELEQDAGFSVGQNLDYDSSIFCPGVEKTERGFEIIRFLDRYSRECSLQQSSLMDPDEYSQIAQLNRPGASAVWFGKGADRAHLSRKQVAWVVRYLSKWLETGSFEGNLDMPEHPDAGDELEHPDAGGELEHPDAGGELEHPDAGGKRLDPGGFELRSELEHPDAGDELELKHPNTQVTVKQLEEFLSFLRKHGIG